MNCRVPRSVTPTQTGLTVLEVLISTFLIAVVVVAALNVATGSIQAQLQLHDRSRADLLAQDLLAEILETRYQDEASTGNLGPEIGENVLTRADFDDVDDYADWNSMPPVDKSGSPMNCPESWGRSVAIQYVDPDDLDQVRVSDIGVKRIIVRVTQGGKQLSQLTSAVTGPTGS